MTLRNHKRLYVKNYKKGVFWCEKGIYRNLYPYFDYKKIIETFFFTNLIFIENLNEGFGPKDNVFVSNVCPYRRTLR